MMGHHALEIINVNKKYGNFTALSDISFKVSQGDFIGLLGVNGAGKTSLISSVAGVNNFDGQIKVMGHDVHKSVVLAKKSLGVVPQELAFDPFLTVYQTLNFQSELYGVRNNKKWIHYILERLHLTDKVNSNTRTLSGGMKRRLMVAQALVHQPSVIILDEPTTGVDVEIRQSLWGFIRELHHNGHTVVLTTHYLEEVEQLCNNIAILNKGKMVLQGTKKEFLTKFDDLPTYIEIITKDSRFSQDLNGYIIKQEDNKFTLLVKDSGEQLLKILTSLNLAGVSVLNIEINRPSLEDVFVHYLGSI
jgi:ABC-2 type transport system ATP-binding protein